MFKIPDNKYKELIAYLKEIITGTSWADDVYIVGDYVRAVVLNIDYDGPIDIVVSGEKNEIPFMLWLANKTGSMIPNKNPTLWDKEIVMKIFNNPSFGDISIRCIPADSITDYCKGAKYSIDAMAYSLTNEKLYDFNGKCYSDAKNRTIRVMNGNPHKFFSNEALEILKAIRLASELDCGIDKETWLGMVSASFEVIFLSQQEITDEVVKILLLDKPSVALRRMLGCNKLMTYTLFSIDKMADTVAYGNTTMFERAMKSVDISSKKLENRLAALLYDIGALKMGMDNPLHAAKGEEMTGQLLSSMGFPKEIITKVSKAVKMHESLATYDDKFPSDKFIKRFAYKCGDDLDLVLETIRISDRTEKHPKRVNLTIKIKQRYEALKKRQKPKNADLPINGDDIMETFNLKPSPLIGTLLGKVRKKFEETPNMTTEDCFDVVKHELTA